jgi:hypothetical protein
MNNAIFIWAPHCVFNNAIQTNANLAPVGLCVNAHYAFVCGCTSRRRSCLTYFSQNRGGTHRRRRLATVCATELALYANGRTENIMLPSFLRWVIWKCCRCSTWQRVCVMHLWFRHLHKWETGWCTYAVHGEMHEMQKEKLDPNGRGAYCKPHHVWKILITYMCW